MAGVGSAVKEAEVLSAFQEINEDLQGKTEVVEKCECWGGGGAGGGKRERGRAGRKERNSEYVMGSHRGKDARFQLP